MCELHQWLIPVNFVKLPNLLEGIVNKYYIFLSIHKFTWWNQLKPNEDLRISYQLLSVTFGIFMMMLLFYFLVIVSRLLCSEHFSSLRKHIWLAVYTILISISKLPHSQSLWRNQMQIADEAKSNIVHQFCSPMWRFPANILKDNTVKYLVRIISGLAFLRASRTFIILVN